MERFAVSFLFFKIIPEHDLLQLIIRDFKLNSYNEKHEAEFTKIIFILLMRGNFSFVFQQIL